MVTVSANDTILFMNASARNLFGERRTSFHDLFCESSDHPVNIRDVIKKNGSTQCCMFEKHLSGGRKEVYFMEINPSPQDSQLLSIEEMPTAILRTSLTGRIYFMNSRARHLLGPNLSEMSFLHNILEGLGRPFEDWLAEVADSRVENVSEFLRIKRNDREIFVQVTLGKTSEHGEDRLILIMNDATELKILEAQFVQSQKMQAIGQLAGGVAHDFNNLLTAISGHCELLLGQKGEEDPDRADLVEINKNTDRAASLVRQLLAYSRKQTLRPTMLDLNQCLIDLNHLLGRLVEETIRMKVDLAPDLKNIHVDPQQFEQVIVNLVVNARDSMPYGGEVQLKTSNVQLRAPLERDDVCLPAGNYVAVNVMDQGVGISNDKKRLVFEPFFTTKRTGEGTGLGLSTAYGIVKQSGGFIFLDSVVGEGTTFTLMFPAYEKKEKKMIAKSPHAISLASHTGAVLLVEDENSVRKFTKRALEMSGFRVLEAESAEQALEILETVDEDIDLFFTDVIMPGMDGPEWVSIGLKQHPKAKVIFVSGYAEESFSKSLLEIEGAQFLAKPFSLSQLTQVIETQLSLSRDTFV